MKRGTAALIITTTLLVLASCNGTEQQYDGNDTIVLKGATLLDGTGRSLEGAVIVIRKGVIQDVGSDHEIIPENSEVIDVTGKFITPGLVDAHIHFCQTGFFDARPDAADLRDSISYLDVQVYQKEHPDRYYNAYLSSGVTAVYDVGGFPWSIELQQAAEKNPGAPHIAAAGPLLTPAPAALTSIFNTPTGNVMVHFGSEEVGRQTVAENSELGSTGIKIWGMVPQDSSFMANVRAVADETEKRGNKLIVHALTLEGAKAALRNNARLLVHSVRDHPVDDKFIDLMNENNAIYVPTLIVEHGYLKAYGALIGEPWVLDDPHGLVDEQTRSLVEGAASFEKFEGRDKIQGRHDEMAAYQERQDSVMALNLRILHDAGVSIAVGTDAGNPGTLHGISIFDELEAMQAAGIPAHDLIIMATRNGALAMERGADFGTLETGKMADLVILGRDPSDDITNMRSISHVMRSGVLRPVSEHLR